MAVAALVVSATACTADSPSAMGSTATVAAGTGDLVDPDVRSITVGDRTLLVAVADSPEERARGLMEVDNLGDLDGMLFDLANESVHAFTMRNTLIDLDIYFFASDGSPVGSLTMEPCQEEPCPTYSVGVASRYAIEVPAGSTPLNGALVVSG